MKIGACKISDEMQLMNSLENLNVPLGVNK